jgi:DNA-directed RNA polymerase specialized sigma24 family protein
MIVIIWLLEETRRTGKNPAASTGHWPDAKDFVCSKARWAITEGARKEAAIASKRVMAKGGGREWQTGLEITPVAPQTTAGDEDEEDVAPPWDIRKVRARPNNAPAPAWTVPGAEYEGTEREDIRKELLTILVKLVADRLAETDPAAVKVYEAVIVDGWSLRDVAKATGLSKDTVSRAAERIKREWESVTTPRGVPWTWGAK